VLASAARLDEAEGLLNEIRASTRGVGAAVLISAAAAVVSLKRHEPQAIDRIGNLQEVAFSTGALDLLVAAYRSSPELLTVLLRSPWDPERIADLVRRARDEDLARAAGLSIPSDSDPKARLSRREREVYDLLSQGLSNRQIAEVLFISESTVKLHAHHIYDKVGVRSRTALAIQAALERADQATSATGTSGVSDAS